MSSLGQISRIGAEEFLVEWQIRDFLSISSDSEEYCSCIVFRIGDVSWLLSIWPNDGEDETANSAPGWVMLCLYRYDGGPAKKFRISVGVRGTSGVGFVNTNRIIEKEFSGYGYCQWKQFCFRRRLIEEKSTLLPDGILTVRCVLKRVFPLTEGVSIQTYSSYEVLTAEGQSPKKRDASTQTYSPHKALPEVKQSSGKKGHLSCDLCVICYEKAVDCILYRCGHMCMCYNCAFKLIFTPNSSAQCPICRNSIHDIVYVYK